MNSVMTRISFWETTFFVTFTCKKRHLNKRSEPYIQP